MKAKKYFYEIEPVEVKQITPRVINFNDIQNWDNVIKTGIMHDGKKQPGYWYKDTKRRQTASNKKDKITSVYMNKIPMAFDIETYTYIERDEDGDVTTAEAYMYIWQFLINDVVIIGRTWEEFTQLLRIIANRLKLGVHTDEKTGKKTKYEARILVANLSYEFQFMRHHINIKDIFAKDKRKVITCTTTNGFYFQDALSITNSNLANIPKIYNLKTQKTKDLDYSIPRNSKTKLTDEELQYCINDVVILGEFYNWLQKSYIDQGLHIPMTSTGILRDGINKHAKDWCTEDKYFEDKHFKKIIEDRVKAIAEMHPQSVWEAEEVREYLFSGGYTHANYALTGKELKNQNVNGVDFTSSYPASALQRLFPVTKFKPYPFKPTIESILKNSEAGFASKFWIRFKKINSRTTHSIISTSKTLEFRQYCNQNENQYITKYNVIRDNGRILYADQVTLYLTDIDLKSICEYYTWEGEAEIVNAEWSKYGRLPDYIRRSFIIYYNKKAILKRQGLDGTTEYNLSKAMVNAGYGCMCEHIHLDDIEYDTDWLDPKPMTPEEKDKRYMEQIFGRNPADVMEGREIPRRVLSTFWAVWITSHSRRSLLENLLKFGEDAIYCDTDSIYARNFDKYTSIVTEWNDEIHKINKEWVEDWNNNHPEETIELANFNDLGEFDILNTLGNYENFKTLGAKRYLKKGLKKDKKTGEIKTVTEQTIAGLPKTALIEYCEKNNLDPFEVFNDNMQILDCKNAHCYNDEPHIRIITDEQGNSELMKERSSVGIFGIDFSMKLDSMYAKLIKSIAESEAAKSIYTGEPDLAS